MKNYTTIFKYCNKAWKKFKTTERTVKWCVYYFKLDTIVYKLYVSLLFLLLRFAKNTRLQWAQKIVLKTQASVPDPYNFSKEQAPSTSLWNWEQRVEDKALVVTSAFGKYMIDQHERHFSMQSVFNKQSVDALVV